MIYKSFQDKKLSALGLGTMRLPVQDNDVGKIDEAQAAQMLRLAMEKGINYYDTAWMYHNGNSELVMGKLLKQYPRDSFYLASKFPGFTQQAIDDPGKVFERQLEKCQVEYFDFYLFHNLNEENLHWYTDAKYGLMDYLLQQKRSGRIRHLGVSVHSTYETLQTFLQIHGRHIEFCQLQLNWLDWTFQDAKAKVELLREYHIPVWVMEPLRGGKLVNLAAGDERTLRALCPDWSPVDWGFRFLQTIPEVTVTLSGMSNLQQLQDNIAIFEREQPLQDAQWDALQNISAQLQTTKTVPCTACRYCTAHCPQQLDIPMLLDNYNDYNVSGGGAMPWDLQDLPEDKLPAACIGCRACEASCPQQIKISQVMADFAHKLKG